MPAASRQQAYCVNDWLPGIENEHMLWANVSAAILAEESSVFSARIAVFIPKGRYLADNWNPRRKKRHFFCED